MTEMIETVVVIGDASSTIITTLFAAISCLAGAIAWGVRYVFKKLDDCEDDRNSLWAALADRTGHGESVREIQEQYKKK